MPASKSSIYDLHIEESIRKRGPFAYTVVCSLGDCEAPILGWLQLPIHSMAICKVLGDLSA